MSLSSRVCENEIVCKFDMVKGETISVSIKTLYLLESGGGGYSPFKVPSKKTSKHLQKAKNQKTTKADF